MILSLIRAFFRLLVVFPVPAGQVPDKTGANGLIGLMQNVNSYAGMLGSIAVSGTNVNLTAAQVVAGIINLTAGAGGAFTVTLPSTSSIIGQLGNSIPLDGSFHKPITIIGAGQTATLTAGDANTTINAPAVISSNVARTFNMQLLNSSNLSFTNMGQLIL